MPDMWTSLQFDSAVLAWGRHVENKLKEVDDNGQPVHTLRDLLGIPLTARERREMNLRSLAMLDRAARQRGSGIRVN